MTFWHDGQVLRVFDAAAKLERELRFLDAIACLEQAARDPQLSVIEVEEVLIRLARVRFGTGDFSAAEDGLQQLLRTSAPDRGCSFGNAHRYLLELYRYTGRLADAVQHATALVGLAEGRYQREMAIRVLGLCVAGEPLLRVVVRPDRSAAASETGGDEELREVVQANYFVELDEALSLPAREYGFDPDWRRDRHSLSGIYSFFNAADAVARSGDPGAGIPLLRLAEKLDPLSPEPPYRLGNLLGSLGDLQGAVSAWGRADSLAPGWQHALENICLAERVAAGGIPPESIPVALAWDGEEGALAIGRGQLYPRGLELAPNLARLWLARGYDIAFSDPSGARVAFDRALATAANEHERTRALAGCGWISREPSERAAHFEEACRLHGDLMSFAMARLALLSPHLED
jgi:tetratricopeptide (TPR) repeat protein